jgi:Xaa-Pro aminopeptidase
MFSDLLIPHDHSVLSNLHAMKNLYFNFFILTGVAGLLNGVSGQPADEFGERRRAVMEAMEPGSVMIIRSPSSSAMLDYSGQVGLLYYLTGLDEPACTLLLRPGRKGSSGQLTPATEILFISPVNSDRINWEAQTPGLEGAKARSGITDVRSNSETGDFLGKLLTIPFQAVYMEPDYPVSVMDPLSADEQLIKQARDHGATFPVKSPLTILNPLLSVKSGTEVGFIRNAVNITAGAQKEAARSIKQGIYEYQVDALINFIFFNNGSGSVAFPGIIGSGINSVVLHWMQNSRLMEEGDLVVVDCGAEKEMYCADITRTYPVSGKFSKRQRSIYEIVLKANEEAIKMVAPGVRMSEVSARADSVLAEGMFKIGLINDKRDFKKYYIHGLSHQIGLKNAYGGMASVLEPGMIITIEPGIYVREEKTGIRIEDDVLVTENGYEVLSKDAPKQPDEVEKLMKETGTDLSKFVIK